MGVSRATFDAATRGLTPDLSLPDLQIAGRAEKQPQQPEFVQTPGQYLRESTFVRLAARGRELAAQYRDTLARIEKEFGVPGNVVLAIWGRETDFGGYKLPHDAMQVLATQAFTGKRKDFFRNEFLHALKMLQDGVPRADMRASWGGAMGLTQFLPSEFYKYAVDFDGDGRADIWHSVPDALASAAKQLAGKGWVTGVRWAYEVRAPQNADCTLGVPEVTKPIGEWLKLGFVPTHGRKLTRGRARDEGLAGAAGRRVRPGVPRAENYFVLKDYNFSDLYVLFVGHLSDRIAGGPPFETPWSKASNSRPRRRGDAEAAHRARALPRQDRRQGRHADARRARHLSEEERPEGRLLADRRGAREHAALVAAKGYLQQSSAAGLFRRGLDMPAPIRVFVFDDFRMTGLHLLGRGDARGLQRLSMRREAFREHAVDRIGPAAVMLDDVIGDFRHGTLMHEGGFSRLGPPQGRSRDRRRLGKAEHSARAGINRHALLGVDDACLQQAIGLQAHQPSRRVISDGEDLVDREPRAHIYKTGERPRCSAGVHEFLRIAISWRS